MKRSKFSEQQIAFILKQAEEGRVLIRQAKVSGRYGAIGMKFIANVYNDLEALYFDRNVYPMLM
ncbi:MAG: hypothetical protein AB1598_12530 [Thermodesulfobacteriota bacterium]